MTVALRFFTLRCGGITGAWAMIEQMGWFARIPVVPATPVA